MTPFEKRLAAAEAKVIPKTEAMRVFVPPSGCHDLAAWEAESLAQAERDGVVDVIVVRFVRPGDVAPDGPLH